MKSEKRILLLSAFLLGAANIYAECECDGGTTDYAYDCDSSIPGNDSCEPCCNTDAGDPKFIDEKIDYNESVSVGPYDGGRPAYAIDFSINFTVELCSRVDWTTRDFDAAKILRVLEPVTYEICSGN
jgi:hypothetical protein